MTLQGAILKLSYATIPLFWPVWICTAVAALYLAISSRPTWRSGQPSHWINPASIGIFALLLPFIYLLLWGIDFAYHDNDIVLDYTAVGRFWPVAIWPHEGRYFPLFAQEFNALSLFGPTPIVYYTFVVAQLVVFCVLLERALWDIPTPSRIGAVAVLICSNSMGIVFADLIYPERNIVFSLAVLIVAIQRGDRAPSRLNLVAALLAAQLALYYKEPAFLLIGTVAVTRLVIWWFRTPDSGWGWLRGRQLEIGLLALCAIFLMQFAISLAGYGSIAYADRADIGAWKAAVRYAQTDPLLVGFVAAIALRAASVRRIADLDPVWDPLALGAVVYTTALISMGLSADRYMPPVDMIALLFAVRQAANYGQSRPERRWLVRVATIAIAVATVSFGAFRVLEHKSVVRGTVALAEFVERYSADHQGEVRVYFPNTEGWRMMNFAAYLKYRYPAAFERVRLVGPDQYAEGRCVTFRAYRCEQSPAPRRGDIIAHLPDDPRRSAASNRQPLFRYDLLPGGVPAWVGRIFYREAPLYVGLPMPHDWLAATAALQQ
jgi:hypothetical protein